jgi:hypothetical protein
VMRRIGLISAAVAAGVLMVSMLGCGGPPEPARTEVVYFHRTVRCPSCVTIENWAKSAVAPDVEAGRVAWQVFNLDEPANTQFEDRYGLMAQSVVVREIKGGKETRWKNLEKVWDLLEDEAVFKKYVQDEVRAFMAAQPETTS